MRASVALFALILSGPAAGEAGRAALGPAACMDCHKSEHAVWETSKHAASFRTVHKSPAAKAILEAAGGETNIRKNATCRQCHFTLVPDEGGAPAAKAAVSCESCHGPASEWMPIHNDYGGKGVSKAAESEAHRIQRLAKSKGAGMMRPEMRFDIAQNCAACHGMARPGVAPETVEKMLAAGHPSSPDWELVRYSQGSVRHRFYPPDPSVNKEMTPAELSRLFVAGQAAVLVSAEGALKGAKGGYRTFQKARAESARKALGLLSDVPEAGALASEPSEANARKLVDAVREKDLSSLLQDILPKSSDYK